jgi:Bacterial TSP3 repeat
MKHTGKVAAALLLAAACTDAQLGVPAPPALQALDNRLEIDGTYCTQPAGAAVFPVKIVFLIDLSGSMCYTDPASGICTTDLCDEGPNAPSNPNPPRRMQAVQTVLDNFKDNPAVSFSVVTFNTSVIVSPFDQSPADKPVFFTTDSTLLNLDSLRNVDGVTDYQGALSRVKNLLSDDMAATAAQSPSELPRTKYAVIFLTDGTPFPHCSKGDPTKDNPPDSAACPGDPSTCTICQAGFSSANPFPGLTPGEDYNEPYQLVQLVNEMHTLADSHSVGDLKFHAIELQTPNAVQCCPVCFADDPTGALAGQLLQAMAQPDQGLGTYKLFTNAADLSFIDYDFTSLQEDFVTRQLIVQPANMLATPTGIAIDSDGDGISDDDEFKLGSNRLKKYSDDDGYSDLFKLRHPELGLQIGVSSLERCMANSPKCPGHLPCDTDGDGLTDCEEFELGTDPELVDTDADGIPDGIEFKLGMDPLRDDTREDIDFDGITNINEVLNFSSVTLPDTRAAQGWAIQTVPVEQSRTATGQVCYSFTATGVTLPQTISRESNVADTNLLSSLGEEQLPLGWGDTLVWIGEAPEGDARDFGRWRVACVRSQWVAPNLRLPVEPSVTLVDSDFKDPSLLVRATDCKGAQPQ